MEKQPDAKEAPKKKDDDVQKEGGESDGTS